MKCGFYEKEITPPLGQSLPGYFAPRIAEGVADRLYAKAAVFEGEECLAVLILDAVLVKEAFTKAVKARVEEYTGIPAEHVVVAANHTHYGVPSGDPNNPEDVEFMRLLERLAADTVILAWQRREECSFTYGMGHNDTVAFVRDYVMQDGSVRTWGEKTEIVRHYSEPDHDLPVLTVWNAEGKRLGVLFTFALHQDTLDKYFYSGDYSSEISRRLKARYGEELVSIYMAGCCGDINHLDRQNGIKHTTTEIGQILAKEILATMEEKSAPLAAEALKVSYTEVEIARRKVPAEDLKKAEERLAGTENGLSMGLARSWIGYEAFYADQDTVAAPVLVAMLGELRFIALPGEVYHQFGEQVKPENKKWLLTELFGVESSYIPLPELLETEIYPATITDGSFYEGAAGAKIVAAALKLAEELE